MTNNPVQILLNAQNYVQMSDVNAGGSIKDFYEGRNAEFVAHKASLRKQIDDLRKDAVSSSGPDALFYARVDLQSKAWAKSHRPLKKLFEPDEIAYVGGSELGTMVVELGTADLDRISQTISQAEDKVIKVNKKGEPAPSQTRSEVGAVRSLRLYGASDRRHFSTAQAVRWLADPRTGGSYYVETFVSNEDNAKRVGIKLRERGRRLLDNFENALKQTTLPITWSRVEKDWLPCTLYMVKANGEDLDEKQKTELHSALLHLLETQTAVKSVILPPVLQAADMSEKVGESIDIPAPQADVSYPIVGIIDTGVSSLAGLKAWTAGRTDFLDGANQDVSHGTFIAGLVSAGEHLNPDPLFQETPCRFFDLGLHPTEPGQYGNYYPKGFLDFLDQLDVEIEAARQAGVRVFNMSLAVTTPIADDGYSVFAGALDLIADKHDVLFVLPAGNLDAGQLRDPWPAKPNDALAMLAQYPHHDRIYQPADSIRAVVVGALNPALADGKMFPAEYSRRGPGPSLGAKPDVAHVGGRCEADSGLVSLTPDGSTVQSCGTSYASPLVAKTLAALDHAIEGESSRESLIALLLHHAQVPPGINTSALKPIARDFVGAGVPAVAEETLVVGDHAITLVFNGVLRAGQELRFGFSWPASLVDENGACSGHARLTWTYRPPVDRGHGGEFVRVNLDAFLRQEVLKNGKTAFEGRLKDEGRKMLEKDLIKNGAKWWPVKSLSGSFSGIGKSSQWRLVIDSLCRVQFVLPEEGIPFCAVLTITDQLEEKPIFNEMRASLKTNGVELADIKTAARSRLVR